MLQGEHYFLHFLLSLFNLAQPSKVSQLIHVFHGRRTPSMLFKVEQEKLYPAFGLFKSMTREALEQSAEQLVKKDWIKGSEQNGYVLTDAGVEELKQYFSRHTYPAAINSLTYATIRRPFFSQFQLAAQIFSEAIYKNSRYSPAIKNPVYQESVKKWLYSQQQSIEELSGKWSAELLQVIEQLPDTTATVLVSKLTGHQLIGFTNRQIADQLLMEPIEFQIVLEQAIEQFIDQIKSSEAALLTQFLSHVQKTVYYGLSKSTFMTAVLLKKGLSIEAVAHKRQLKLNTIREHVLEISLVHTVFDFMPYIPKDIHRALHNSFDQYPAYSFKEAKQDHEDLLFLWYRLVEIERIRNENNKAGRPFISEVWVPNI